MCKKASRQINALKRISKFLTQAVTNLPTERLSQPSLITARFLGFSVARKIHKLEKLQERALRLVFCDQHATYIDLLRWGKFFSLSAYRFRCLAVEVYKRFHGLNPPCLNDLFTDPSGNENFREKCRLNQPKFNTYTCGFRSFKYYGSKLWNSLPRFDKEY